MNQRYIMPSFQATAQAKRAGPADWKFSYLVLAKKQVFEQRVSLMNVCPCTCTHVCTICVHTSYKMS